MSPFIRLPLAKMSFVEVHEKLGERDKRKENTTIRTTHVHRTAAQARRQSCDSPQLVRHSARQSQRMRRCSQCDVSTDQGRTSVGVRGINIRFNQCPIMFSEAFYRATLAYMQFWACRHLFYSLYIQSVVWTRYEPEISFSLLNHTKMLQDLSAIEKIVEYAEKYLFLHPYGS